MLNTVCYNFIYISVILLSNNLKSCTIGNHVNLKFLNQNKDTEVGQKIKLK